MFYEKQMKQKQIIKANNRALLCLCKAAVSPPLQLLMVSSLKMEPFPEMSPQHPPKKTPAGFYFAQGYPCSYKELTNSRALSGK